MTVAKPRRSLRATPWSWVALGGAACGVWVVIAALGGVEVGLAGSTVSVTPAGAAAAAAAALLAGCRQPSYARPGAGPLARVPTLLATFAGLFLLPAALAPAASGDDARPLIVIVALSIALGAEAGGRDRASRLRAVALAGMGVALIGATVFSRSDLGATLGSSSDTFGAALILGAVAFIVAGVGGSVGVPPLQPLLAVGLLGGLIGAAGVGGAVVPLLAGAAAVGIAGVRPAAAVAIFAVAVAALPGGQPAASLIGAGAVVAIALGRDWAVVAALPGGVALVAVLLAPGPLLPRVAVGVAAVLVDLQIGRAVYERHRPGVTDPRASRLASPLDLAAMPGVARRGTERARIPALVIGAWLLIAPGTWSWVGDAGLRDYDAGAGRAVAVAAVVMTAIAALDGLGALRRGAGLRAPAGNGAGLRAPAGNGAGLRAPSAGSSRMAG